MIDANANESHEIIIDPGYVQQFSKILKDRVQGFQRCSDLTESPSQRS